jgi:hypothetical protein
VPSATSSYATEREMPSKSAASFTVRPIRSLCRFGEPVVDVLSVAMFMSAPPSSFGHAEGHIGNSIRSGHEDMPWIPRTRVGPR